MTDYTELIRSLRNCSNNRCTPCDCGWFNKYQVDESCKGIIMWKAAAAIEALQAELEKKRTADCWGCKCEKLEPKRGKWIVHTEVKNIYGGICIECPVCRDHFVVLNVSDEKYCRSCGAKMTEVQDDKA